MHFCASARRGCPGGPARGLRVRHEAVLPTQAPLRGRGQGRVESLLFGLRGSLGRGGEQDLDRVAQLSEFANQPGCAFSGRGGIGADSFLVIADTIV